MIFLIVFMVPPYKCILHTPLAQRELFSFSILFRLWPNHNKLEILFSVVIKKRSQSPNRVQRKYTILVHNIILNSNWKTQNWKNTLFWITFYNTLLGLSSLMTWNIMYVVLLIFVNFFYLCIFSFYELLSIFIIIDTIFIYVLFFFPTLGI